MSRIGREPISVPAGVEIKIDADNLAVVKGPKGTLTQQFNKDIKISQDGAVVTVTRPTDEKEHRSLHGLTRTLLNNMVVGVSAGFEKKLEIVGVGYRAAKTGTTLQLTLGYSHSVSFNEGNGITFDVPTPNEIVVKGADKQQVGQIASEIRGKRPPEPYLGKGIKYQGERIRRKAGKAGKK